MCVCVKAHISFYLLLILLKPMPITNLTGASLADSVSFIFRVSTGMSAIHTLKVFDAIAFEHGIAISPMVEAALTAPLEYLIRHKGNRMWGCILISLQFVDTHSRYMSMHVERF